MHVVIVGAGLSGLTAARTLRGVGVGVELVDKGRSPGGRMATRRLGEAVIDHGAQFFTVRTPAFQHQVDDWMRRDLVRIWSHGFGYDDDNPRYIAVDGMNSLAKDLAVGLDVACSTMAFSVRRARAGATRSWMVVIDDGSIREADAVVITTPLPQAFALLGDTDIDLDEALMRTDYDRTIALLATLDRPSTIPSPGAVQDPNEDVAFVADNAAKGVSAVPAITLHASPAWSETHWDDDDPTRQLVELATPWLGTGRLVEAQVKKWRFARPRASWPDPCWLAPGGAIVLCGDAFDGPRIEAAHNSGLAAAHALTG